MLAADRLKHYDCTYAAADYASLWHYFTIKSVLDLFCASQLITHLAAVPAREMQLSGV
jgi:hypothetical protein